MTEEPLRCRGMRDLLPREMARFREVERVFRDVCLAWGYEEVRTPTIEQLDLFTGTGTLSPQMLGRVYSFLDWDGWTGERVVLRPDGTIPAARLFLEHLRDRELAKLFYVQNVFRFAEGDEPREDWQCGVELIGETQPQGDVELVLLGREVLETLGLGPVAVRLSHPGIIRAVLAKAGLDRAEQLRLYDRILDGDLSAFTEVEKRLPAVGTSLELLLATEGEGTGYLANVRSAFLKAIPELTEALDELMVVTEALAAMDCYCLISAALVRNFEYYTGPVFHFVAHGETVGGGGRYDSLIALGRRRFSAPLLAASGSSSSIKARTS
ncbi:MAG: histidine--tRNA ligase family protein [Chloroflexi bacterium]|nr:histidine--tRNA ligase family protein [Chloroflexota bacterium]